MKASDTQDLDDFGFATVKQTEVLELLANHRTSKEMAAVLGIAEATINRRIEMLRTRLGGITRHELARRYREWSETGDVPTQPEDTGVENSTEFLPLAQFGPADDKRDRDVTGSDRFNDVLQISINAPWSNRQEPRIVPGVLDGNNALFTRGAAIAIILFGIIASLVLGLAAASAITEAIGH